MNRTLPLCALLAAALLAGCTSSPERDAPAASQGDGRCDAEPVQYLVGERITVELAERARELSGANLLRVVHPQQPVTMDYNPQRLNIDIDDDDSIIRLSCG